MATPFRLKRSAVSGKRPTLSDLLSGELALNTYDGHIYAERDTGGVGIGTTIALLTPWIEQFGGGQINYTGVVSATTYYGEGGALTLGTPSDSSITSSGALNTFQSSTKLVNSVDDLNELAFNIIRNTAVTEVDFSSTALAGGSPLSVTLSITHSGNANRYDVDWGDGSAIADQSTSSISHVYTQPNGGINTVTVTARNNTGVGAGSSYTLVKDNYITVYTPDPDVNFAFYPVVSGGSSIGYWDDGSVVYLENTTTNVTGFAVTYSINYGDGSLDQIESNDIPGGVGGGRTSHTFTNSVETDTVYNVTTTLNSHPAADPAVIPASETQSFKVYSTHTPEFSSTDVIGINKQIHSGFAVTFTNNTENTVGNFATFGNTYLWTWGDGDTQVVQVGSESNGDTGQSIAHTFSLSEANQLSGISETFETNLRVITNHTSSPFITTNTTITVEPEVRSIFAGVATVISDRTGDNSRTIYDGTDIFGRDRRVGIFTNTSQNATTYTYSWGDGSSDDAIPNNATAGGTSLPIYHTFEGSTGTKTITLTANGTPGTIVQNGITNTKQFTLSAIPAAPTSITNSNLTLSTANQGSSPKLCANSTINVGGAGIATGASVVRYVTSTPATNQLSNINGSHQGTLEAFANGVGIGSVSFTTSVGETGTFSNLIITGEGDAHDRISSSIYPTGFYQVFSCYITKPLADFSVGLNDFGLTHSVFGSCGFTTFVKDTNNSPSISSVGILSETSGGTKKYISGIPYYNSGNATLELSGVEVSNFTSQTFLNSSQPVEIDTDQNYENTTGDVIGSSIGYAYTTLNNTNSSYLDASNIPLANTGVGFAYTFAPLSIPLTLADDIISAQNLKIRASNCAGIGTYASNSTIIHLHTAETQPFFGIDETQIQIDPQVGDGSISSQGVRIFDFNAATTDTPSFNGATNFYTNNVYTILSDPGVSGTKEATIRNRTIKHDTTDYSTNYLPVGPDRSGDTGTQYFTFAFRRKVVSNFSIQIDSSTGISGLWIAAPGTNIDTTSGLNGWLRTDNVYSGSGIPGGGPGGNGGDGCALTPSDRIIASNSLSGQYNLTLGSENLSNATNNVCLIRIALSSGQTVSNLSILP